MYTKGGFQNQTQTPMAFNGWLALQTQTVSIPQHTIEAQGSRTFRTNAENSIHISVVEPSSMVGSQDDPEELNAQVLATSTLSAEKGTIGKGAGQRPRVGAGKHATVQPGRTKMVTSKQALQAKPGVPSSRAGRTSP